VWETARPFVRSGWSTPAIWKHDGGEDLVVLGSGRLSAYDLKTGDEKWFTGGFSRETIAQPISGGGLLFASAAMLGGVPDETPDPGPFWKAMLHFDADGDGRIARHEITEHFTFPLRPELPVGHPGFGIPLPADPAKRAQQQHGTFAFTDKDKDGFWTREEFLAHLSFNRGKPMLIAIRPGGAGDVTDTHVVWRLSRSIPEIPSPVFHDARIYMVRTGGLLTCVDARDGRIIYTERLPGAGQYSASPVIAGGHLYMVSNSGAVSVVKAGDRFELLHSHELGEGASVTPAFDATTIYIRTAAHLRAFRAGGSGRP
jgi:outer membrane protein assembly factor BamB